MAAKLAAGLKANTNVELLVLPEPKTIFEQLFGDSSAEDDAASPAPLLHRPQSSSRGCSARCSRSPF